MCTKVHVQVGSSYLFTAAELRSGGAILGERTRRGQTRLKEEDEEEGGGLSWWSAPWTFCMKRCGRAKNRARYPI